jgi:hypothetical protein
MILRRAGQALIALAAYSACAAATARGRRATPGTLDLALAFAAAGGAAVTAARLSWLGALAVALGCGIVASLAGMAGRDAPERPRDDSWDAMPAWKRFSRAMGNFQSRLLLGGIYFVLLAPFALAARYSANPLAAPEGPSRWRERGDPRDTLDDARRQS